MISRLINWVKRAFGYVLSPSPPKPPFGHCVIVDSTNGWDVYDLRTTEFLGTYSDYQHAVLAARLDGYKIENT